MYLTSKDDDVWAVSGGRDFVTKVLNLAVLKSVTMGDRG